jgi:D-psicose/D-tagatose/L-ribulose 3-epimerase
MKIGINMLLWTAHVTEEHFPLFGKLKAVGFDGIEIPVHEGDEAHYATVRRALEDHGLECTTSTAMPGIDHNAISPDMAERERALDYLKHVLDCGAELGAELLMGPFYQPLGHFTGLPPTGDEKQRAAEVHRAAAKYAAERGMRMSVEFLNRFECHFLNTLADAAEQVRLVGQPNFGATFDTFHANIEEKDPVKAVAENIDAITHVHVCSNDRGTPGKGHIPFEAIFGALKAGGYDGWYTIEAFGGAIPALAKATCVWRDFFPNPEEVYTEGFKLIKSLAA